MKTMAWSIKKQIKINLTPVDECSSDTEINRTKLKYLLRRYELIKITTPSDRASH